MSRLILTDIESGHFQQVTTTGICLTPCRNTIFGKRPLAVSILFIFAITGMSMTIGYRPL